MKSPHEQIGYFVSELRRKQGLSQKTFAALLETSASSVARMERGEQNMSTTQLVKISEILNHNIFSLKEGVDFQIEGGKKLRGSIATNPSKNGALHLMCASLINKGTTTLHNIPRIEEIFRMLEVFESIGVDVKWIERNTLKITPPKNFKLASINGSSAGKMRSVIMIIGAMIHFKDKFSLPHAGGCDMGERTIAAHKHALEELGMTIKTKADHYEITRKKLKPAEVIMYEASDTAVTNALIAASLIPGRTILKYAPPNYEVQDVCFFLERLGVQIDGIGTTTLTVHGIEGINTDITHHNSEDPIESMMFISAAAITNSKLKVKRCPIDFLEVEMLKLKYMGLKFDIGDTYLAQNQRTKLADITVYPSKLVASPVKIHPLPYPGLNTDNLPFFVPIATQAKGATLIHDWMWENRAIYFTELNKLGANVALADPHRVFVNGPSELRAAQVVCPPALRPAAIVLIAMLAAKGTSILRNVYPIERGYELIAERLSSIGADIKVLRDL